MKGDVFHGGVNRKRRGDNHTLITNIKFRCSSLTPVFSSLQPLSRKALIKGLRSYLDISHCYRLGKENGKGICYGHTEVVNTKTLQELLILCLGNSTISQTAMGLTYFNGGHHKCIF